MDSRCYYSETWSSIILVETREHQHWRSHTDQLKEVDVPPIVDRTDPEDVPEEDPFIDHLLTIVLHLQLSLTLLRLPLVGVSIA